MDLTANEKAVHADFFNGESSLLLNSCNSALVIYPSQIEIIR